MLRRTKAPGPAQTSVPAAPGAICRRWCEVKPSRSSSLRHAREEGYHEEGTGAARETRRSRDDTTLRPVWEDVEAYQDGMLRPVDLRRRGELPDVFLCAQQLLAQPPALHALRISLQRGTHR